MSLYIVYRRESTRDPNKRNDETIDSRRVFTYVMTAGVGVTVIKFI